MIGGLLTFQIQEYTFKFTIISDDEVTLGYDGLPCCDDEIDNSANINFPTKIMGENKKIYHFRSIETESFYYISGNNLNFPNSIESISNAAFKSCTANKIDLSATNIIEIPTNAFIDTIVSIILLPECVESIGDYAFKGSFIQEFVSPSQLKMLGIGVFDDIFFISVVDLTPSKLISIADRSFAGALVKYILPDTVISIGKESFRNAATLLDKYPKSLQVIEDGAFRNVQSIANFVINLLNTNLRVIGPRAFIGIAQISSIALPDTVEEIGEGAFDNVQLGQIDYSKLSNLKTLGSRSFAGSWVRLINLSNSMLTEIGEGAFDDSINLNQIILPPSLQIISPIVRNCPSLENLEIPKSINSILDYGFSNLTSVVHLLLSHINVNTIPNHCFSNCPALKIITLPPTITSISQTAFSNLTSLNRVFACGPRLEYGSFPSGVSVYTSEVWNLKGTNDVTQIASTDCVNTDPLTLRVYGVSKPNVLLYVVISVAIAVVITLVVIIVVFSWKVKITTIENVIDDNDSGIKVPKGNRRRVLTKVPKEPHYLTATSKQASLGKKLLSSSSSLSSPR